MRPIDADRLKAVLEKNFGHTDGASVLEQLIDEQPTIEPSTNCSEIPNSSDTISRQAVIDTLDCINGTEEVLRSLPPAQPEQQNGRVFKGIVVAYPSYSAYPEYKGKPYFSIKYTENGQEFIGYSTYNLKVLSEYLKEYFMPPAQPEALTDKEQRLFLAAMGREEKVCRQVDDECKDCREPYEESLVRTCHEITRKVKGALWT